MENFTVAIKGIEDWSLLPYSENTCIKCRWTG
jgi:hypothetical protein